MAPRSRLAILSDLFNVLARADWHPVDGSITPASLLADGDDRWFSLMQGRERASIFIMPGLDPDEMLADYSCKLSPVLDAWVDRLIEAS
jgi:hypothetical protein